MGLVTDREGRAAADIASRVSGVSRVTTAFTYINKAAISRLALRLAGPPPPVRCVPGKA